MVRSKDSSFIFLSTEEPFNASWRLDSLEDVFCDFEMEKYLPSCEHTAVMPCGQDPSVYSCLARCDHLMECCSKTCRFLCHQCQTEDQWQEDGKVIRTQHRPHPCEKRLHCSHPCREKCSSSHEHTKRCMEECRQSCKHAKCHLRCSEPCAPCQEPCGWSAFFFFHNLHFISHLIAGTASTTPVLSHVVRLVEAVFQAPFCH